VPIAQSWGGGRIGARNQRRVTLQVRVSRIQLTEERVFVARVLEQVLRVASSRQASADLDAAAERRFLAGMEFGDCLGRPHPHAPVVPTPIRRMMWLVTEVLRHNLDDLSLMAAEVAKALHNLCRGP